MSPRGRIWRSRLQRLLAWSVVADVLAVIYLAYLDPHVIVDLATRFWSCF
jgi:hypothetical protein